MDPVLNLLDITLLFCLVARFVIIDLKVKFHTLCIGKFIFIFYFILWLYIRWTMINPVHILTLFP
jgi:hypothetical protein